MKQNYLKLKLYHRHQQPLSFWNRILFEVPSWRLKIAVRLFLRNWKKRRPLKTFETTILIPKKATQSYFFCCKFEQHISRICSCNRKLVEVNCRRIRSHDPIDLNHQAIQRNYPTSLRLSTNFVLHILLLLRTVGNNVVLYLVCYLL
jgi:hypothetical protein